MKKTCFGFLLAILLFITSSTAYAAAIQIKIDGVTIASDVLPEIKSKRTMVPLRVISENLGASVEWSNSAVILTKNDLKVIVSLNSSTAEKNGEKMLLDVKPYMKSNRIFVPLRFIAETFGGHVHYSKSTVSVDTKPFLIEGVQVKTLQQEYHMIMGGVVQQVYGNSYNEAIHSIFVKNKGEKVEAPANYSWSLQLEIPGSYYKNGQYDFEDYKGNKLASFDIYTLIHSYPAETLSGYPEVFLHDVKENAWYMFSEAALHSINHLMGTAAKNGFLTIISDTVV
ncbi:stalk domain-containing protein [Paenibacillus sp. 2TAB23]|uniref:stalk domain-containing protein n=1 Tax=Paenibacillus sp. 2TAB23 TaxID=3233004 RepID=UPI003F9A0060